MFVILMNLSVQDFDCLLFPILMLLFEPCATGFDSLGKENLADKLTSRILLLFMWCGYKITRLNFFLLPCKLGNSEQCVVLACALLSIHGYNFKVVWQFGSSLCLKWIVFLFSLGIMLSVNMEQCVNAKFFVKLGENPLQKCMIC